MKHESKFNSREEQQNVVEHQTQQNAAAEFATAEELLRHDALHTPVPPAIASRLQESIGQLTPRPAGWWRRFFGS